MKKILILVSITISINSSLLSQSLPSDTSKESSLLFSGSIDTYYRKVLGADDNQAPGSSFANANGFSLGMVNLKLEKKYKKIGFLADLVAGPRGQQAVFNATGSSSLVNQLNVYWNATDRLTLTLGSFNTFFSYEVISPTSNFNYSTTYMFSYGPFNHSGFKATYVLSKKWSLLGAIMNPTDFTVNNFGSTYLIGGQITYKNNYGTVVLNSRYGDEDGKLSNTNALGSVSGGNVFHIDLVTGWFVTKKFYIGYSATYLTKGSGQMIDIDENGDNYLKNRSNNLSGFYGNALFAQFAVKPYAKVGIRAEYFQEVNAGLINASSDTLHPVSFTGVKYDADRNASVVALTASMNYVIGPLTLIPEVRVDIASEGDKNVYGTDSRYAYTNGSSYTNTLTSVLLAAVYKF